MKNIKYIIGLFLTLTFFVSCEEENQEFGAIISPKNVQISAEIAGADANNPFGDGSGIVTFKASADNAITYKFVYDGTEIVAASGSKTYTFGTTGTNKYTVTAIAVGTAGASSSTTMEVEILVLYSPPADLLTMLTADSSRTWKIKAGANKHFGLGPVGGSIQTEWYGAGPNDKEGLGMYDDRFVFNVNGAFTLITNGTIFGKADPITADLGGNQGLSPNGNGEFENFPFADFNGTWALSAPGGVETISLSGIGFIGFYIGGSHQYQIFSRSENEMVIKSADGKGEFDWWFTLEPAND